MMTEYINKLKELKELGEKIMESDELDSTGYLWGKLDEIDYALTSFLEGI